MLSSPVGFALFVVAMEVVGSLERTLDAVPFELEGIFLVTLLLVFGFVDAVAFVVDVEELAEVGAVLFGLFIAAEIAVELVVTLATGAGLLRRLLVLPITLLLLGANDVRGEAATSVELIVLRILFVVLAVELLEGEGEGEGGRGTFEGEMLLLFTTG